MRLSDFKVLTFDCYGTLIDWETGILTALAPLLAKARVARQAALEAFGEAESAQEAATPALRYPDVLARVHATLGVRWGVPVTADESATFGASVKNWPAFPDSAAALAYLKRHYRLVILSNVDRTSFARSSTRLGVAFDAVYTAEDIGSYKPDPRNFAYLLDRLAALGFGRGDILHVAQSLYHDHVPAEDAGLTSAWIDRRGGASGGGATRVPERAPRYQWRFESLAALADLHRGEQPAAV
ncbi:MAG TPA: haloacid dehalogenase type II [Acetobacteraceae bacterium]|jgi:2-haloacid dehalogenase|nr:haloacid dehalogenase type II [Acetobacteraceae bacterium]